MAGVIVASWCRKHYWARHPHGPSLLTPVCLVVTGYTYLHLDRHEPLAE
ncbi:hypothetical protein [Nocardia sp. NPDC051750]